MTVYYREDGRPSRFPTTREHSSNCKIAFYDDGVKCTVCNVMSVKYTHNGECRHCVNQRAIDLYNLNCGSKFVFTDEKTGKHYADIAFSAPREIPEDVYQEMLGYVQMVKDDPMAFTISTDACKVKAHFGLKKYGKCFQCEQDKMKLSPRQEAMRAGETWYTPLTPCKKCGETAPRNVHNGQCQACDVTESKPTETPDMIMMRENPDMIISREDARALEMKVYRTGNACRKGHKGWRYVSTGNCISCIRG